MDIKIFVCCHQPVEVPQHPLLVPLQVGAALADSHFPGFLHDDTGDNISIKNRSYCELTGQYWAWKNVEADYYGFYHYRRYLYPDTGAMLPYKIERRPTSKILERLNYSRLAPLIEQYDFVLPQKEDMLISVRKHYVSAQFHHEKDLKLVESIILEDYPEYKAATESYFSGSMNYFGNIFIMRKQVFQNYCSWLFRILKEFDQKVNITDYAPQDKRVNGYLAERLLGIYQTYHQELTLLELPRVHFITNPFDRYKNQMINMVLPPGSKRRNWIKQMRVKK